RHAAEALLAGHNPYDIVTPNPYHPDESVYGPGLVKDGVLQFGFPYPPLTAVLAPAGQFVFRGLRHPHRFAAPGRGVPLRRDAGLLFLLMPRNLFLIEHGWTEPTSFLWLALFALRGRDAWLGLALASKQYLVWLLPFAPRWRAALLAGATLVPFFLWHPAAF